MEEKMAWMKNVGIVKLPEPVSYLYQFKGHDAVWLLTEREVAEKPLDELRTMFEQDREEARISVETRKGQTMRCIKNAAAMGAVLELNDVPVAEQECRMSENFCVIPDEQSKTLTISAMGEGPVLKLTKRKARLMAEIILDQTQKWEI